MDLSSARIRIAESIAEGAVNAMATLAYVESRYQLHVVVLELRKQCLAGYERTDNGLWTVSILTSASLGFVHRLETMRRRPPSATIVWN
jgi:hypothetical protein